MHREGSKIGGFVRLHSALLSQTTMFRLHCGGWVVDCASRQAYNVSVVLVLCEAHCTALAHSCIIRYIAIHDPAASGAGFPLCSMNPRGEVRSGEVLHRSLWRGPTSTCFPFPLVCRCCRNLLHILCSLASGGDSDRYTRAGSFVASTLQPESPVTTDYTKPTIRRRQKRP